MMLAKSGSPLIPIAIVVGIFLLVIMGGILGARQRRKMLQALGAEGWDIHVGKADSTFVAAYEPVGNVDHLTNRGSSGIAWHATGSVRDRKVHLIEHRYTTGSGKSRTTHVNTIAWVACPVDWRVLRLRGESVFRKLEEWLGGKDIQVEDEKFNKRWKVTCADEDFALVVLSPEVQAFFNASSDRSRWNEWWHIGRGVICCGYSSSLNGEQIRALASRPVDLIAAMQQDLRDMVTAAPDPPPLIASSDDDEDDDDDEVVDGT